MSDVMIRFKKTYTSIEKINNKLLIKFSNACKGDNYKANAFINDSGNESDYMYISAFLASEKDDGKLYSSNDTITKADLDLLRSKLEAGKKVMSYDKYMYLYTLLLLITKNYNMNDSIGTGTTVSKNGLMNDKGMFFGSDNRNIGNKVFGIENLWSSDWTVLDGIFQSENKMYKKLGGNYADIESYDEVNTDGITYDAGYISRFVGDADFLYPTHVEGSSSTYSTAYNGLVENDEGVTNNIFVGGAVNDISSVLNIKSGTGMGYARLTIDNVKED